MSGKQWDTVAASLLALLDALPETRGGAEIGAEAAPQMQAPAVSAERISAAGTQTPLSAGADAAAQIAPPAAPAGEFYPKVPLSDESEAFFPGAASARTAAFRATGVGTALRDETVEELDRCFRRDSRRYDGGFGGI